MVLNRTAAASAVAPALRALHQPIAHRGPDGERVVLLDEHGNETTGDARLGLAFRRLKIIDTSAAAGQPMRGPDGTWIVFNGEIYNFAELRRELETRGHRFITHGDTEVILAAYREWGSGCFARFDGMWAIGIVDPARRQLVVSRDRFGIKPLLYANDNGRLLFASEIKQLLAARQVKPRANVPLVRAYLDGYRYPVTDETFFEGIRSVPPSSFAVIPFDGDEPPRFEEYWRLDDHTSGDNARTYDDAVSELDELLERAVASHRVADVRVGGLMSGGLDSSTLLSYVDDPSFRTMSLSFRDAAPQVCEMPYVEAMLRRKPFDHAEITFDAAWVARNADRVLHALEEPPLGMPALAQFRVFELCRERGVTVVLDGQGADEILAGYPYHQRALLKDRLVSRRFGSFVHELRAAASEQRRNPVALAHELFIAPRFRAKPQSQPWIAPTAPARAFDPEVQRANRDRGRDASLLNQQLHFDVRRGNVQIVLGYGDRNAMAHSVEARVPYFDRALVEFAFSLPDAFKGGNGSRKRVLRDVARRRGVPPEITERRDRLGFGVPDERMLREGLRADVEATLHDASFDAISVVDAPTARAHVQAFGELRHNDHRSVWRLYVLARWSRLFDVSW